VCVCVCVCVCALSLGTAAERDNKRIFSPRKKTTTIGKAYCHTRITCVNKTERHKHNMLGHTCSVSEFDSAREFKQRVRVRVVLYRETEGEGEQEQERESERERCRERSRARDSTDISLIRSALATAAFIADGWSLSVLSIFATTSNPRQWAW